MNILLTLLFGCPQPPPAATTSMQNQSNGQNGQNQQGDPNAGGQNGPNQSNGQNGQNQQGDPNAGGMNNPVQPSKGPPIGGKMDDPAQDQFGYPEADGEIIQDAIVIKINNSGNGDPPPQNTQEELRDLPHVTFSGTIVCEGEGCDSPFVLRVVPFQEQSPTGKPSKNGMGGLITIKDISTTGSYDVLIPKSKKPVVVELLVDMNKDGKPTVDERLAVMERGGQLIPYEDIKNLKIDCGPVDSFGPIGGAVSPDAPAAKPPQKAPDTDPGKERNNPPPGNPPQGENPPPPGEQPSPDGENAPPPQSDSPPPGEQPPGEQPPPQ